MSFEREFLRQAAIWISCRWRVMQGDAIEDCNIPFQLDYDLLGCNDSEWEMRLLCQGDEKGGQCLLKIPTGI